MPEHVTDGPERTAATVREESAGRVRKVVLDGPRRHNVLDLEGWRALERVFGKLAAQETEVGCVLLSGAGGRAFSAGSDIRAFERQRKEMADVRAYSDAIAGGLAAVRNCPHPVLAVVEGLCVGGGLEIAACCDIRICGESSRFGAPVNRLGLTMAHAELRPLVELMGRAWTSHILLTGDLIGAEEARAMGLVTAVCPDAEVAGCGLALAERISAGAPLVNRWHKRFIDQVAGKVELSAEELDEPLEAFATRDHAEGRAAFVEKRKPEFTGA